MTLPSSGPISLSMIQAEFGGATPVKLSNYYRGGALVPNTGHNAAVPTSGPISLSSFYGTSRNQAPVWNTASGSLGSTMEGEPVSTAVSATDPDSYPSALTYTVTGGSLPPGLSLNGSSGAISGTLSSGIIGSTTAYNFTITASDGDIGVPRNFAYTVQFDTSPTWSTPSGSLGEQFVGSPFSFQLVATDPDGPSTLTYSVTSGALPGSLSMTSGGLISGTLTAVGVASFNVTVSDGVKSSTQGFSITVDDVAHGTQEFTSTGDWTVPSGVTTVIFSWIVGGGAGGGTGGSGGSNGSGGGGGSGGWYQDQVVSVTAGDAIHVDIGAGGAGGGPHNGSDPTPVGGTAGGNTDVLQNGSTIFTAFGGNPGSGGNNGVGGSAGSSGSPNGNSGAAGQGGSSDLDTKPGGAGGSGPVPGSSGGAGGPATTGSSSSTAGAGSDGVGVGSGGGGGGVLEQGTGNGAGRQTGGAGQPGYVLITY